jgi:hypothetical protein
VPPEHAQAEAESRPEPPAVAARKVLLVAIGFLAFVGASLGGLGLYYRQSVSGPVLAPRQTFPEPRLQASPEVDLADLEHRQEERLGAYAWIDRDAGLVQIPIDRAMALIAARGDAAWAPLEPSP